MVKMFAYFVMGKQVQEKHIQCSVTIKSMTKEESYLDLLSPFFQKFNI